MNASRNKQEENPQKRQKSDQEQKSRVLRKRLIGIKTRHNKRQVCACDTSTQNNICKWNSILKYNSDLMSIPHVCTSSRKITLDNIIYQQPNILQVLLLSLGVFMFYILYSVCLGVCVFFVLPVYKTYILLSTIRLQLKLE